MRRGRKNRAKACSYGDLTMFDTMMPNYSLLSISFRIITSFLIAIVIIQLIKHSLIEIPSQPDTWLIYFRVALTFLFLGEVLILLDGVLERFLPFPVHIKKRFALQFILSVLVIFLYFKISLLINPPDKSVPEYLMYFGFGIGFIFIIAHSNSLLVTRMTQKWVLSQKEMEEMEQEKIKIDYENLQEQLNPNFLFTNLSVLKSLIIFDKEAAAKFTDNFTDVYRYALQSKKENMVALSKELEFIKSYIALHKERLGGNINICFELDDKETDKKIVPRTLQLLIENAIRHNIVEKEAPLQIKIAAKNDELLVENKINIRQTSNTSKKGLIKLRNRYEFLTEKQIQILRENGNFKVIVPLL